MNQLRPQSSSWYRATTLTERIELLHVAQNNYSATNIKRKINTKSFQQHLQRWKSQPPFTDDFWFARCLAINSITEEEFLNILSQKDESIQALFSEPPDWLEEMHKALARFDIGSIPLPEKLQGQEVAEFLDVIGPLIHQGRDRLHQEIQVLIQTQRNLPLDPKTVEILLFASLPEQLLSILSRTMVLELNVARLQGVLSGNTPQERFQSFLQRLRQPENVLSLFQEYPVLARQLVISINRWVAFSLEFLRHLCQDWEEICSTFSPDADPGLLVELNENRGDTHRGGRAVLIAKFTSGFQLVYKPKSLAVDIHFQQLLAWLNQRGNHPPFRTLKILDRETYGWVEFVTAQGCTNPTAIHQFYERQGAYLGLLYSIEATDFHSENLIADGEHPVLVDLESLFHLRTGGIDISQSDLLAFRTMTYSVLRVGLLPIRYWADADYEGLEMSGLGGKGGQLTPNCVSYLEAKGTDEMRFAQKRILMSGSQNRPTLNDAEVSVLDYAEAITTGFSKMYRLLMRYQDELLSEKGPLACFAEDEVRVILRPTRTYGLLLHKSFHPDFLRSALDRDRLFDQLWLGVEQQPYLQKVIAAERDDLLQMDIPMFATRPNSRAIWSSSNQSIGDFFDETGMNLVHRRIQQLNEGDLRQQLWFIRASLATLAMTEVEEKWPRYQLSKAKNNVSREQLLTAAQAVGERLEMLALRGEHDVSWIGLSIINYQYWSLGSLGVDLYSGLPGVVLFLAYLGCVTNQQRYTTLAKVALATMQHQIENSKGFITSIGGFAGWGGIIYTLTHLGVLWQEKELLAEAESLVELLPDLIAKDEHLDIIRGAAGCIGSLINLYRFSPSQHTLNAAIQCGDRLLTCTQAMEQGIGWSTERGRKIPLAGFSHGCAGIAWALLELSALTGEERFRAAALEAIAYERSLFSLEAGNWPDLREFEDTVLSGSKQHVAFMTTWCHGAPGIGLGRLRSLPHLDDLETRAEVDTAIKTTLAQGFGTNHSLCHGDLGNVELLLQASVVFNEPQLQSEVNRLTAEIFESINKYGWLCGVPLGVETPGLMTGLAGIGYGLLRLAEPTRVPSVLVLEPPMRCCRKA